MFRIVATIYVLVHGLIHLIGFVVPWRIVEFADLEYSTKIFFEQIDIGDVGQRIWGLVWLGITLAYLPATYGVATDADWTNSVLVPATVASLVVCVLGLPDTVVGILANVIILGVIFWG